jgi:hypothetical protein
MEIDLIRLLIVDFILPLIIGCSFGLLIADGIFTDEKIKVVIGIAGMVSFIIFVLLR